MKKYGALSQRGRLDLFGLEILGFGNQNVGISNLMAPGDSDYIPYTINPPNTNETQPFEDVFPIEKW